MMKKGGCYRNRYTGKTVTIKVIESVRIGPGDRHVDVVVLEDGGRWRVDAAHPNPSFGACHEPAYHFIMEGIMPKTISKKERCSEQDIPDSTGWHYYQCSRRGTIDEDGKLWCFQHTPSAKRKRRGESDARYKADQDRRLAPLRKLDRLRTVNAQLLAALEGLKCWGCEYPLKQPDYAGCYSCKSARDAIEEAKK